MATGRIETERRRKPVTLTLVLALMGGGLLAGLMTVSMRATARESAVGTVNRSDGYVWYDSSWSAPDDHHGMAGIPQHAPRLGPFVPFNPWLKVVRVAWGEGGMGAKKIFKDECAVTDADLAILRSFDHLQQLVIENAPNVTDAGLAHLEGLTQLRFLSLGERKITDAGLAHLKGLTELRFLGLSGGEITDAGLRHLGALSKLEIVNLEDLRCGDAGLAHLAGKPLTNLVVTNCPITDAGLAVVKALPALSLVYLNNVPITDAGLAHLESARRLRTLNLGGTRATDTGVLVALRGKSLKQLILGPECSSDAVLATLRPMQELNRLSVSGSQVTDAGLVHLAGVRNLSTLSLSGTRVTDEGLLRLKDLPQLEFLFIDGNHVTAAGAPALKAARPGLSVKLNGQGL